MIFESILIIVAILNLYILGTLVIRVIDVRKAILDLQNTVSLSLNKDDRKSQNNEKQPPS